MSTDLAIYRSSPEERWRYCQALAEATLLPGDYKRQPANLLLALESGAALNVAPMVAIQEIHIIKGKPSPSSQLQAALVRRAGHILRVAGDSKAAWCEIIRADDPGFTFRTEWTIERAQTAGLMSNDMWKKYPENMLKARAISECARNACPDVIVGFGYTPEELGDETDSAGAEPTITVEHDRPTPPPAATEAEATVEDAVLVEDPPVFALVSAASSKDEMRALWTEHAPSLTAADKPRLAKAMTDRAEQLDAMPAEAIEVDDVVDAEVIDLPAEADHSGPANRTDLQKLGIKMRALGIKDRADELAWVADAVGRTVASRNELTHDEITKAIQIAAWALGEDAEATA